MGTVVEFPSSGRFIKGKFIRHPSTRAEYLAACKQVLSTPDYELLLLAILDKEYYDMASYGVQGVVKVYHQFEK